MPSLTGWSSSGGETGDLVVALENGEGGTIEALAARGMARWAVRRRRDWIERERPSMREIAVRFFFLGRIFVRDMRKAKIF
jgi:hypothetical protein